MWIIRILKLLYNNNCKENAITILSKLFYFDFILIFIKFNRRGVKNRTRGAGEGRILCPCQKRNFWPRKKVIINKRIIGWKLASFIFIIFSWNHFMTPNLSKKISLFFQTFQNSNYWNFPKELENWQNRSKLSF